MVSGGRDKGGRGKPGEDSDSKKLTNSRDREPCKQWERGRREGDSQMSEFLKRNQ